MSQPQRRRWDTRDWWLYSLLLCNYCAPTSETWLRHPGLLATFFTFLQLECPKLWDVAKKPEIGLSTLFTLLHWHAPCPLELNYPRMVWLLYLLTVLLCPMPAGVKLAWDGLANLFTLLLLLSHTSGDPFWLLIYMRTIILVECTMTLYVMLRWILVVVLVYWCISLSCILIKYDVMIDLMIFAAVIKNVS